MASFMGKDGFVWWQGVVEDRHDPLYLGRCKVRILGWHTDVRKDMPISSLPWAYPIQPITSAAQTGVGISPTGPVEGTWVVGFFRDGEAAQEPVFFGTLGGIPEAPTRSDQGFGDPRVVEPPDEGHPFKALAKRLLKYDVNNPNARVPRAPDVITHYGQGDTLPDKDGGQYRWMTDGVSLSSDASGKTQKSVNVLLEEQGTRSNYPDLQNFEGEPTTPRAALGQFGNIEGKGYYSERGILGQKVQWRSALSAGGFSTAQGTDTWNEPDPSVIYGAIYPYNHVHQSESGHILEVDDTPGKERLHRYHRAGTFEEIGALGQRIMKVANENFNITLSNDYTAVKGNKYENIAGKLDVVTKGGWFQESKSVNVSTIPKWRFQDNTENNEPNVFYKEIELHPKAVYNNPFSNKMEHIMSFIVLNQLLSIHPCSILFAPQDPIILLPIWFGRLAKISIYILCLCIAKNVTEYNLMDHFD